MPGFLSADRTTIFIDEYLYSHVENRYLFTVAHELGHLVLHGHHYRRFESDTEWIGFHCSLPKKEVASAEFQANTFAGLVLVPESHLQRVGVECFQRLAEEVLKEDPEFDLTTEAFWSYVAEEVGKTFKVHESTARFRLENDKLWGRDLSR